MRAWSVLRQLLAATLCAVLAAPAYPSENTLPRSSSTPSHTYDTETLSKTRVWGSNEEILLHIRAVLRLNEKQHKGCWKCRWKNVVGSVVTYDYDAFGNLIHSTGTTPNNYLFAGEQFDPDINLYYDRARYLNVTTGRFWNIDTDEGSVYEPASLHKYLYAGSNPVGNADPSGHEFGEVTIAAGEANAIGAKEDAAAISIYQTAFRTTLYAGRGILYETPTLLLRAAAALTAFVVAAASVFMAFQQTPGELPDVAQSDIDNKNPILLFRDTSGTSASDFKWRGPTEEPDGLSFFEQPFMNPKWKPFSVGFPSQVRGRTLTKHARRLY